MSMLFFYVGFYVVLEVFEVQWQKAQTIMGMLARMYAYYQKSIFLFLAMHPTFYFAVWFLLYTNYNGYAFLLFGMKSADIATKIMLMKKVFIDKDADQELQEALFMPVGPYLPYIGLLFYPFCIVMALV